ncbi:hypothetical protein RQP46_009029 [Phenoliferia psychrophenolica]
MADWEIKLVEANPDSDVKPAIPDVPAPIPPPAPAQQPSPQPRSPSVDSSIQVFTPDSELPEHPSGVPYKGTPWEAYEDEKLQQLVEERKDMRPKFKMWQEVAPLLGRTPAACSSRWRIVQPQPAVATTPAPSTSGRKRDRAHAKQTPTPAKGQTDTQNKKKNNNNNSEDDYDDRDARHKHRRRSPPSPSPAPVAGPSGSKAATGKTALNHELVFIKAASDRLQDQISRMGTATGADAWRLKAEVEETRTTLGNALKAFNPGQ